MSDSFVQERAYIYDYYIPPKKPEDKITEESKMSVIILGDEDGDDSDNEHDIIIIDIL